MCLWQGYFILVALMESCVNSGGVSSRVLVSGDSNAINHIMVFPACSYMSRMATIAFKSRTCCLSSDICLGAVHSVTHSACCRHVATGGLVEASAVKLEVGAARGCAEFLNSAGAGPDGVDVVGPGSALGQVVLACTTFGDIATKT